ncbi:glycosyltransferase [uncultured Cetobacterium sp.]|uniref:glycosyltransferase n=1 Tax=uncultured Cetobacterium sp. TaxID=527638 RepID=UPI0025E48EAA|nr:glycosyltransferase [uncultured Cetobacterium sp.]
MKKIVFNTDSLILGGAEKIALDYVAILSKKYEVELLINEDNGAGNKLIESIPKNVKYRYVVSKETIEKINRYRDKKKNILYKILYSYFLKKRRAEYKKNIVQILKDMEYDYLFDFYCKIPIESLDQRAITFLHSSLGELKDKKRKELQKRFDAVGKIIVVSDSLKNEVQKNFKEYNSKLKRIYNFFDFKKLKELSKEKIEYEKKYILACSRLDKNKDLITLIKAFKSIESKVEESLYIVGDGPEYKNINNFIKENRCEDKVKMIGQQSNPYKWMKNCELFVHSSKREGFGMVLVEAMSFGKNVVATDCPIGPSEILGEGRYGELVSVGDWKKLGESLVISLEKKSRFNEDNIDRALEFSKENIEEEIYNLIGE